MGSDRPSTVFQDIEARFIKGDSESGDEIESNVIQRTSLSGCLTEQSGKLALMD